jgi:hypothetical protein
MSTWTDEEISTLISLWPTHTVMQITNTLHRSYSAIRGKTKELRNEGLLEAKNASRRQSINPDPQDFDKVKRDYRRKHHITVAQLCARLDEGDDQLAAELYARAQVAKLTRLRPKERG